MAAGKITKNVTYATGNTVPKQFYADDTVTPTLVNDIEQINDSAGNEILGLTTDAAVTTDATGTLQQYLRGLVKLIAAGINVVVTSATGVAQNGAWSTGSPI